MSQFDNAPSRVGSACFKWDFRDRFFGRDDVLPLSVADMDFMSAPVVLEALQKRVAHGIFGYTGYTESFIQSIVDWNKKRYGWAIEADWIMETPGVIPAMHFTIQALTDRSDRVLTFSPVYNPFFDAVKRNDRTLVVSELINNDGRYKVDWKDFEKKLKGGVKLVLWCNPHNPVGRVWTVDEQTKLAKLCKKYGARIVSDEIHADIIYSGHKHVPIASLSESISSNTITLTSPGKTFNIQGLHCAALICSKKKRLKKIREVKHRSGLYHGNALSMVAYETAYSAGEPWLEELLQYLEGNLQLLRDRMGPMDGVKLIEPEGTYIAWLDCRGLGLDDEGLNELFLQRAKLGLIKGVQYGKGGEGFMRINFAVPRSVLEQALTQMEEALQTVAKT